MAQHFLASKTFRDLPAYAVARMSDGEALAFLAEARWGSNTEQGCPACGFFTRHKFRKHRSQWRCIHCDHEFSVTSSTVFADRKLPLRKLVFAMWHFVASPAGISALFLSAELGLVPRVAAVLLGKLREVVLRTMDRSAMDGIVEVDGGHFGGKPRRPNFRQKTISKHIAEALESGRLSGHRRAKRNIGITRLNQKKLKNRRIAIVARLRSPTRGQGAVRTLVWIGKSESPQYITPVILRAVAPGSLIVSDEGSGFSPLKDSFDTAVVPHSQMYCTPSGVNENQAESYMSRARRMEWVHHGHHGPKYIADYMAHAARLEDDRRLTLSQRLRKISADALNIGLSIWWRGYFQGKHRKDEILCDQIPAELCIARQ